MRWADGFIAVDWGTTNRRAYLIDASGDCAAEFEDAAGILSVEPGGFPEAVRRIRERLGDKPLLLGGMIGSNRGWLEAPYAHCPAGAADLAAALVWAEDGRAAIVPGVAFVDPDHADVMRGEEVQIIGAIAAGLVPDDCLVCHPGTHNKWIRVTGGRIASFRTVMTGEIFNLLREHSILAELLAEPVAIGDAFRSGVRRGLAHCDLTAELFSVRARVLLDKARREDAASFTSGLLIGSDIAAGLGATTDETLFVMGRPELTALYAEAIGESGRKTFQVDGEQSFLAGIRQLAERIE